jgi:long-chain fatty acid transport protein
MHNTLIDLTTNHKSFTSLQEVTLRNFSFHVIGTIVLSVLVVCIALGGGYQLNEQGARAVGMGGAFVARASDPSAIYFNPAGLAFQSGINVLGGVNFILPSTKFKDLAGVESSTKSQVFTPVNLYGTYQLNDQFVVGLGVFNPFGLGTDWGSPWEGDLYAVKSTIVTWYINPTVAYKINDQLSVGVGVSYIIGKVTFGYRVPTYGIVVTPIPGAPYKAPVPASATKGDVNLDASATGIGFNVGVIYKPVDKLSLGLSFRSETKLDFSGTANFTNMQALAPYFPGGDGKATLPMPMNIYAGAAYDVSSNLTLEADFQYVGWSDYKELAVTLPSGPLFPFPPPPISFGSIPLQKSPAPGVKNWNDGYLLRGGAEYKMDSQVTLRGGLILDLTPQPPSKAEPMLPDGDRVDICLGGSYKISDNFSVDASYMLVLFMETNAKSSELPGTYNSNAHIISVNLGYSF